jgi:DNA-binding NarL/FixJ family response regulator
MTVSAEETIRVAVVHSQALAAAGLAALLEGAGLEVVATAPTFGELLATASGTIDVVVLEPHLLDGVLIATRVRELDALGVNTVVLSRRTDAATVAAAMRAGARAFVATSDSPGEFVAAVRTAARGGHHLAEHRADAVRSARHTVEAGLGKQEERALVLYANGKSLREVAMLMDTTEETVKSYVKRARRKYRNRGIDIGTRSLLRDYSSAQGWTTRD